MKTIEFTVEGVPVPKGRARVTSRGGFARAYTPAKTVEYENLVKAAGVVAMNGQEPLGTPLRVNLTAYMPIPKSLSKKARADILDGITKHTKKPDCSNLLKSVEDALNGICYIDDSQIIRICINKVYSHIPRMDVHIVEHL